MGRGVVERPLPGRNVVEAPFRRGLSTFTYLAVTLLGDERDRSALRAAVNRSHSHVRSGPGSRVAYSAFDPDLQLWVAACLHAGWVDALDRMHGPLPAPAVDTVREAAGRFATTLQVPPDRWPATRAELDAYWQAGLASLSYDDEVRAYLRNLLALRHLPGWLRLSPLGRFLVFTNRGFLPAQARNRLGIAWTEEEDRRFGVTMRRLGLVYRHLPGTLRTFPLNWCLRRFRRRTTSGRLPW